MFGGMPIAPAYHAPSIFSVPSAPSAASFGASHFSFGVPVPKPVPKKK